MKNSSILTGTLGGTFTSLLAIVGWADAGRTLILGGLGAVVSYFVSLALKNLTRSAERKWFGPVVRKPAPEKPPE